MSYFERLIVNMLTFISLSVLLPQMVHVQSFLTALLASFVLSILNLLIKPILTLLSLPLTILTMGLFSFLINAAMLQMTSSLVGPDNFGFSSFGASLLVAVIMAVVNLIVTDHNMRKYMK
ncbi:membrane protein [Tetragenococcus halophilus subsp. flandriensis]|uniref:phage holin family protein n=1 Tax=Tetragenococcus halophilus TaxID=51669 RepID=UPI0023E92AFC|nr:phage holin family protein [Tetragenococcus halophilus]GMA08972.1 membrane protein [Tetragenococcus halophilus subsp. flandriensis]